MVNMYTHTMHHLVVSLLPACLRLLAPSQWSVPTLLTSTQQRLQHGGQHEAIACTGPATASSPQQCSRHHPVVTQHSLCLQSWTGPTAWCHTQQQGRMGVQAHPRPCTALQLLGSCFQAGPATTAQHATWQEMQDRCVCCVCALCLTARKGVCEQPSCQHSRLPAFAECCRKHAPSSLLKVTRFRIGSACHFAVHHDQTPPQHAYTTLTASHVSAAALCAVLCVCSCSRGSRACRPWVPTARQA